MLPKATWATWKVQGSIINFWSKHPIRKKLDFHEGVTYFYIVSKFQEHPTKNDFHVHLPKTTFVYSTVIWPFRG